MKFLIITFFLSMNAFSQSYIMEELEKDKLITGMDRQNLPSSLRSDIYVIRYDYSQNVINLEETLKPIQTYHYSVFDDLKANFSISRTDGGHVYSCQEYEYAIKQHDLLYNSLKSLDKKISRTVKKFLKAKGERKKNKLKKIIDEQYLKYEILFEKIQAFKKYQYYSPDRTVTFMWNLKRVIQDIDIKNFKLNDAKVSFTGLDFLTQKFIKMEGPFVMKASYTISPYEYCTNKNLNIRIQIFTNLLYETERYIVQADNAIFNLTGEVRIQ